MNSPFNLFSTNAVAPKRVCKIAFTQYSIDGRVRLEAESLVKWGYEVCFLVPKEKASPRTYSLAGVTVKELDVVEYGGKRKLQYLLAYFKFMFLAFLTCTRLFFQSHVRIFHVHNMPNLLVFVALIPRLFGSKVILDVHDTIIETYRAKFGAISPILLALLRFEEWISCSMVQNVIAVNHVQRESLIRRGVPALKIATVITMPRHSRLERPFRPNGAEAFRIVNHGTISKRLGNDLLLHAATQLVRDIPGFELHIIGGGDNLDECKYLSESLEVTDFVYFHKSVPWDQLANKLGSMDVGIVANRVNAASELMLPAKLIDYVVLGIPAIVPRLKTIEYYFTPEMVTFFQPENVDSIVEAIVTLYRDKPRRERQVKNARSFLAQHGWESNSTGLKALYNGLGLGSG